MTGHPASKTLRDDLDAYLGSLPLPGRELTAAAVEEGQRSKAALVESGATAVPVLLDGFRSPDFYVKDACYDLILAIGGPAKEALYGELGRRGPIVDIWITALLEHLGDATAMDRLWPNLGDPSGSVRRLTALALAFRMLNRDSPAAPPKELLAVLVEALDDEQPIEGTPFTVAGSALGCLTRLSGMSFLSPPREIQFYNFEHFLYPPPLHPFPFAADYLTKADESEQRAIRQRARAWLESLA